MLLYKYLEYEHAISSISKNRIKVSTIDSLNDPYEMLPCVIDTDGTFLPSERCREVFKSIIGNHHGFVCLSETLTDPVMWAHYAAKHTGVAFEFEIPDNEPMIQVKYKNRRVRIHVSDVKKNGSAERQAFNDLLRRKFKGWSYEQEYRDTVPLSQTFLADGLRFRPIPKDNFRRVILGLDCPLKENAVQSLLGTSGFHNVGIARAKLSDTGFKMFIRKVPARRSPKI